MNKNSFLCTRISKIEYYYKHFKLVIMSEIEKQVRDIIVEKLCVSEDDIKLESKFQSDLGADSLDTVELIMEFERVFNVSIPDDQAEKIATVADAVQYIEEHKKSESL